MGNLSKVNQYVVEVLLGVRLTASINLRLNKSLQILYSGLNVSENCPLHLKLPIAKF